MDYKELRNGINYWVSKEDWTQKKKIKNFKLRRPGGTGSRRGNPQISFNFQVEEVPKDHLEKLMDYIEIILDRMHSYESVNLFNVRYNEKEKLLSFKYETSQVDKKRPKIIYEDNIKMKRLAQIMNEVLTEVSDDQIKAWKERVKEIIEQLKDKELSKEREKKLKDDLVVAKKWVTHLKSVQRD